MAFDLENIPTRNQAGAFHVVVESPRGSGIKFKYETVLGAIVFDRPLTSGLVYPFDWGFVPGTRAPDGDPLDALVMFDQPTYPGVVIACRTLGVIRLKQKRHKQKHWQRNDRVIAVPLKAPRFEHLRDPGDLSQRQRDELDQFFLSAILFEDKEAKVLGWGGCREAENLVDSTCTSRERS